jgi:hypothetical protein
LIHVPAAAVVLPRLGNTGRLQHIAGMVKTRLIWGALESSGNKHGLVFGELLAQTLDAFERGRA